MTDERNIRPEALQLLHRGGTVGHSAGAIAPGLEADLVVLGRSPLRALEALKDIRMIMNDGEMAFRRD